MTRIRRGPLIAVTTIALVALVVPLLPLADPAHTDLANQLASPSLGHPLGLDNDGRDLLSRLLWSARTSLFIAVASALLASLLGASLGIVIGSSRGMDVVLCFPPLLIALLAVTVFCTGVSTLIPVFAVLYTPAFVRVMQAATSQDKRNFRHADFHRIAEPLMVQLSIVATSALILESGLSFLGLGVAPPTPSWGQMIGDARATLNQAPMLLLWPSAALSLTILAMNALSAALRDAAFPHTRLVPQPRHAELPPQPATRAPVGTAVLDVRNMTIEINMPHGVIQRMRDMSFAVRAGETVAIVGERGAGKSLTGLALLGLLPPGVRVRQGSAWLQGHNLLRQDEEGLDRVRGGVLSMIFDDLQSGLDPVHRVGTQIAEVMHAHFEVPSREAREEVIALLRRVGIPDPERCALAYPHELSDTTRLRTMIALAVTNNPRLLIADEPTAGLDATTSAQILDLLTDLRRELGMGLIFLSGSLPLAAGIADRVLVMQAGEIVEQGAAREVLAAPLHPYTAALLRDTGPVPQPHVLPRGCTFAPRCPMRAAACEKQRPPLVEVASGRATRCLRWQELTDRVRATPE